MASASVSAAAGLERADCLGSVGRRWANYPITAHPKRRMHSIPLRVVLRQSGSCSIQHERGARDREAFKSCTTQSGQINSDRSAVDSAGKKNAESTPVMYPSPNRIVGLG